LSATENAALVKQCAHRGRALFVHDTLKNYMRRRCSITVWPMNLESLRSVDAAVRQFEVFTALLLE
jgi:hypothetical protein